MRSARKRRPRGSRRPPLLLFLVLSTLFTLLLATVLLIVSYRLVLTNYYMRSIQRELKGALTRLEETEFSQETLDSLRQEGIRILLVDPENRTVAYEDMYFLQDAPPMEPEGQPGESPPDAVSEATPWENDPNEAVRLRTAVELVKRVDAQLPDDEGEYFSTDSLDVYEQSLMQSGIQSKAIFLNGRRGAYYFSLCVPVESVGTSLTLAIRFATVISAIVWMVSLPVIYLFYRRITKPAIQVARTADRISQLDFSSPCPPANTREFDTISGSVNRMAEHLQAHISLLENGNRKLEDELEELDRQRQLSRELIANLSHDLKTPIAIISSYAEGLSEGVAETDEQRERYIRTIREESEHMQGIVSKMLLISRLEAGADPILREDFDLSTLIASVCESFSYEIKKNGLQLTTELETPLPVCSDYERIRQVVINVVQNSVFHINGGSRIRVVAERADEHAVFRVANSSAPIIGEAANRLWEELYRGDYARRRDRGEAGLGLSIVRKDMEQLGQPYGFRNLETEGMVEFYIELPLAEGMPEQQEEG